MIENLALEASAGSGKTFALSTRYVALIILGEDINKIMALTFTNKAANEMKERVQETFLNLENKKNEMQMLSQITGLKEEEILKKRDKQKEKFLQTSLKIGTIDSFFAEILRKFSLYLGVLPDFQINEDIFQNDLKDYFANELVKNKKQYESFIYFASNENMKFEGFFDFLSLLYEKKAEKNLTFQEVDFPDEQSLMQEISQMKDFVKNLGATQTTIKIFETNDFKSFFDKTIMSKENLSQARGFKKILTDELENKFQELRKHSLKYLKQKEAYILFKLFSLFEIYENSRLELAKVKNELSFLDVSVFSYILLKEKIDSDFLYFRLDSKMEHILIDEFQDTSIIQYQILYALIQEAMSGISSNNKSGSFFYVGDVKQSIYRFRGGVKELFSDVASDLKLKVQALDVNYRSSKFIVEFVNKYFKDKFKNYLPQKSSNNAKDGFVAVVKEESFEESIISAFNILYESNIKEEIAILCWTNEDASIIEDAILQKFPDVSISKEVSLSLFEIAEVRCIIEFLKFAYFKDEIYAFNAKALQNIPLEDSLPKWNANFCKKPLQLVLEVLEVLKLNSRDKNILKFLEFANEFSDIESFLFTKLNPVAMSNSNSNIRVLTIHQSKGLQFEYVIVADKSSSRLPPDSSMLIFDYESSKLKNIFYKMKNREFVDEDYRLAKEKDKLRQEEDRLNATYVALTRAKSTLIVATKDKSLIFKDLEPFYKGHLLTKTNTPTEHKKILNLKMPEFLGNQEVQSKEEENLDLKAIQFGLALHFVLEMIENFDEDGFNKILPIFLSKYKSILDEDEIKSLQKRVLNLLRDDKFKVLLSGAKIYKEQPLMYNGERKQLDLLLVYEHSICVIDYKSSKKFEDKHKEQILYYKKALSEIYPSFKIKSCLIYLLEDKNEILSL